MAKTSTASDRGYWIATALYLLIPLLTPACKSGGQQPPPGAGAVLTENIIQEGDVLLIAFPAATNLNTIIKVPFDGAFELPFTEPIQASGKTPRQLQEQILEVYGPQLQVREATVTIMSTSASVYVSGAVLRPGKLPLDRPLTAMEAIMESGGFDHSRALPDKVQIIRREGDRQITMQLNLKKALKGQDSEPFFLRSSDIVHVPFKTFNL